MRTQRLAAVYLLALIALGAMSTSAASARTVVVLKEEGKPVAVGTELSVELNTSVGECDVVWPGAQLMVNQARKDTLATVSSQKTFEVTENTCKGGEPPYHSPVPGLDQVTIATGGGIFRSLGPFELDYFFEGGLGGECEWSFSKFIGTFPTPGSAVVEGVAANTGHHFERDVFTGQIPPCGSTRLSTHFMFVVRGHNGKPLETELITHHR